ncbi:MAG: DUF721 domain-containing protein [Gammaproteobacteria bacterium]|nr:DUF721 domain-containing protein [Gammaproteobacteria bacterium]
MQAKSHSLKALLNGNAELRQLTASARHIQQLHAAVCRQLPASLSSHCVAAEQQADTLVIYMDNAANATLLRYQQQQLVAQLASLLPTCKHVQLRVLPQSVPAPQPQPATRTLSGAVRAMLENTAAALEDGALRRSLQNLARGRSRRP